MSKWTRPEKPKVEALEPQQGWGRSEVHAIGVKTKARRIQVTLPR